MGRREGDASSNLFMLSTGNERSRMDKTKPKSFVISKKSV
jgi:hypothetical protein